MDQLIELMSAVEEEQTLNEVKRLMAAGAEPLELLEALRQAMSVIGERFEKKEYFLSELIMSAEIFDQAVALLMSGLKGDSGGKKGTVVLGTVQGDIHYIGKNLVATLLRCEGYEVHDLGEDVKPETFVAEVQERGADVLGLSALLTTAFEPMKETIDKLAQMGLREKVKVIIGGAPVDESVVDYCGADRCGKDAGEAVQLVNDYLG